MGALRTGQAQPPQAGEEEVEGGGGGDVTVDLFKVVPNITWRPE